MAEQMAQSARKYRRLVAALEAVVFVLLVHRSRWRHQTGWRHVQLHWQRNLGVLLSYSPEFLWVNGVSRCFFVSGAIVTAGGGWQS
jgi:hypothetical protein